MSLPYRVHNSRGKSRHDITEKVNDPFRCTVSRLVRTVGIQYNNTVRIPGFQLFNTEKRAQFPATSAASAQLTPNPVKSHASTSSVNLDPNKKGCMMSCKFLLGVAESYTYINGFEVIIVMTY